MVGTIFTKYWYIIDAVGETFVSVCSTRSSDTVRWGGGQCSLAPAVRFPSFLQLPQFPVTSHECLLVGRRFKRSRTKIHDKCFHREDLSDIIQSLIKGRIAVARHVSKA